MRKDRRKWHETRIDEIEWDAVQSDILVSINDDEEIWEMRLDERWDEKLIERSDDRLNERWDGMSDEMRD